MLNSNEANKRGFFPIKKSKSIKRNGKSTASVSLKFSGFFIVGKFEHDEDYLLT